MGRLRSMREVLVLGALWLVSMYLISQVAHKLPEEPHNPLRRSLQEPRHRSSNKNAAATSFPSQCTHTELATIRYQLPPARCTRTANYAWQNRCSFSYATRCPEAVWLEDVYRHAEEDVDVPVAIYVGCNKGMDAINTLRMLSANETIDKSAWKERFFQNQTVHPGHCAQESTPQYAIPKARIPNSARVYCIEAMPNSAQRLLETAEWLGYNESLKVTHAAVADHDGSVLFPQHLGTELGMETLGLETCELKTERRRCQPVPQYRLDRYRTEFVREPAIHLLSIDVEGFDFAVLQGGRQTLKDVHYLEFEYSWKGSWRNHSLSEAIQLLREESFVCYWAGRAGNLWRLTDCWMDHYDLKFWSNVACVNLRRAPVLYSAMEGYFQQTLMADRAIRYHNATSANTDGRLDWGDKKTTG